MKGAVECERGGETAGEKVGTELDENRNVTEKKA